AEVSGVRPSAEFHYEARIDGGATLPVARYGTGGVCAFLPHVAPDAGPRDDAPERYVRVSIRDGVARGPLIAHLYDLGPSRGYRLAGLERPEP
ncbi:MAG: hypothetical protein ACRELB_20100, partial [Polyangiaceae bacterium]